MSGPNKAKPGINGPKPSAFWCGFADGFTLIPRFPYIWLGMAKSAWIRAKDTPND